MNEAAHHTPLVLTILDGWGLAPDWGGNAISIAKTPIIHEMFRTMPHTELQASGEAVGLPNGVMGNSEVGHLNIGAGRIVEQYLPLINDQIKNGEFFKNPVLLKAMTKAKNDKKNLHLIGIFSDGGVHGHIHHLHALLEMAKRVGVESCFIHAFTDGRDSEPTSALGFYEKTVKYIKGLGSPARFGTVIGRFYAMDRDNRWERTAKAYGLMVAGQGTVYDNAGMAISDAYKKGMIDEFIDPCVIRDAKQGDGVMHDGDVVICYNFRSDRMRQMVKALCKMELPVKMTGPQPALHVVTFTEYQRDLPVEVAFHPEKIEKSLSVVIADAGLRQFHIAETEKYAHVTYFFNGGIESPQNQETRLLIPSPKVTTYDKTPEMSARPITKAVVEKLHEKKEDFFVINYANADMVGHTGNIQATVVAVETIDQCLGILWTEIKAQNGTLIITADHGNAEQKVNPESGLPDTEHTTNPVPFIIATTDPELGKVKLNPGILGNIAPTILGIMGIAQPPSMDQKSLIQP